MFKIGKYTKALDIRIAALCGLASSLIATSALTQFSSFVFLFAPSSGIFYQNGEELE